MRGKLTVNPGGFAFARPLDDEGDDPDVFIPPGSFGGALDGDEVQVQWRSSEKGPLGRVQAVLKRGRHRIVGVARRDERGRWRIEPDDPRLIWPIWVVGGPGDAEPGLVVSAEIVEYPEGDDEFLDVCVERVLGEPGALDVEIEKILIEHSIETDFPTEVEAEAQRVPQKVRPEDLHAREDLRSLPFMTIDPPDARDFDDAVCVEEPDPKSGDVRLWVAVADVSHYVREGTAIDEEAVRRSFSTYLPHRAIPMLPEQLSSHMCSLVPHEDRLAMVATMIVRPDGEVKKSRVMAAVIHSQERLTYEDVARELDGKRRLGKSIATRVTALREVADRLRGARLRRGAIELDLPETKIELDDDDRTRIRAVLRSRSTKSMVRAYNLIEELMIAANEAVGHVATKAKLPIPYRVHGGPDESKLELLAAGAESLGVRVRAEKLLHPRGVQKFLSTVANRQAAQAMNMLLLRAMAQAEYETDNIGHFALASSAYVHFTSPIRRYPDLIAHRVLKAHLRRTGGKCGPKPVPKMPTPRVTAARCGHAGERERASATAERDARALFAAMHMRDRVGDRFEGTISGFSATGIFVQLDDPFVDGMIRLADFERELGGRFERHDSGVLLLERRGAQRKVAIGDRVIVELVAASMARRQIDFYPIAVRRA